MRHIRIIATAAVVMFCYACAAPQRHTPAPLTAAPLAGLPTLAELAQFETTRLQGPPRMTSTVQSRTGAEFIASGGGVMAMPPQATLSSSAGTISWAIYQFNSTLDRSVLRYTVDAVGASEYYVALSDYQQGRWRLVSVPLTGTQTLVLGTEEQPGAFSSGTATYVAVLVWGGQQALVDLVRLVDDAPPAVQPAHSYGLAGESSVFEGSTMDGSAGLVACGSAGASSNADALLLRVGPDGQPIWSRRFNGVLGTRARDVERDPLTGDFVAGSIVLLDAFTQRAGALRVDSNGALQWAVRLDTPDSLSPRSVDIDAGGNSYHAGDTGADGILYKLDVNGNLLWAVTLAAQDPSDHLNLWEVVEAGAALYLACTVENAGAVNGLLLKLSTADGSLIWGRQWSHGAASGYFSAHVTSYGESILYAANCAAGGDNGLFHVLRFDITGATTQQLVYSTQLLSLHDLQTDAVGNIFLLLQGFADTRLAWLLPSGAHATTWELLNGDDPPSAEPYYPITLTVEPAGTWWLSGFGHGNLAGSHWDRIQGEIGELDRTPFSFSGSVSPLLVGVVPLAGTLENVTLTLDDGGTDDDGQILRSEFDGS